MHLVILKENQAPGYRFLDQATGILIVPALPPSGYRYGRGLHEDSFRPTTVQLYYNTSVLSSTVQLPSSSHISVIST
jgi:hypothetical protein